ncbi:5'-3' exoribonuclease, putative [Perkinsus marinus ATCC 50983]|uniref:5'-3' exoribonuclease n=1 Tax=Perkinsus marinus (strain ATCC 50983 / TXsc) TaxID=423536 RepID=C5K7B3_PERM5|nr:5'-3' exoribonuclease, putative [Perkinsus marinus ATCC 50983]EER19448.1 5'-3' exoribonuclease, putative [Perkinsus marinus ATCC 50983]|eukprot:XP_002787652.1 5'-3' exoribonuclease, putative [Perkinsus marinus ATCC 50983]
MGVPTFFRWLCTRYPKVIKDAVEKVCIEVPGEGGDGANTYDVPVDFEEPNPNGIEFDNLYLDLNGIIHPCCHPEDGMTPENEDVMFLNIMRYVDRLVRIVRPRKLLYVAIDGVAPRAKMNQQRARRFKAAQEATEQMKEEEKLRRQMVKEGREPPSKKGVPWDSNVITPGTPFLDKVAHMLHWYISDRMTNDPLWQLLGFRCILSDAGSPGEGEHKIMDFIRKQRMMEGYNPNTTHMLYGADADLIMLGLATHEISFYIIREVVLKPEERKCYLCGKVGHLPSECTGDDQQPDLGDESEEDEDMLEMKPFQIISLPVLREYLVEQFTTAFCPPNQKCILPFPFDVERVIDDFVFMCFFVGNDFLPHLPSLNIRDGSIDQMICLYVEILPTLTDYLTCQGEVNLVQVEVFLDYLGRVEDEVFRRRLARDDRFKQQRLQGRFINQKGGGANSSRTKRPLEDANVLQARKLLAALADPGSDTEKDKPKKVPTEATEAPTGKQGRHRTVLTEEDNASPPVFPPSEGENLDTAEVVEFQETVRQRVRDKQDLGEKYPDRVRLGEGGEHSWKQRYYTDKFHVTQEDFADFIPRIRKAYVEGICWVLQYYYQGVVSWDWFYPYHYAPFATDLVGCSALECNKASYYTKGKPFLPLQQLMSVLPPRSGPPADIPVEMQKLMTEPNSSIIDFYPEDFALDLNGKKFTWQAVILLPFIIQDRLIAALQPFIDKLDGERKRRNTPAEPRLFVHMNDTLAPQLQRVHDGGKEAALEDLPYTDPNGHGSTLFGVARAYPMGGKQESVPTVLVHGFPVKNPRVVSSVLLDPVKPDPGRLHQSKLLPGIREPTPTLTDGDLSETGRLRGFGGEPAKRMILQCLQRLGFQTRQQLSFGNASLSGPPPAAGKGGKGYGKGYWSGGKGGYYHNEGKGYGKGSYSEGKGSWGSGGGGYKGGPPPSGYGKGFMAGFRSSGPPMKGGYGGKGYGSWGKGYGGY